MRVIALYTDSVNLSANRRATLVLPYAGTLSMMAIEEVRSAAIHDVYVHTPQHRLLQVKASYLYIIAVRCWSVKMASTLLT